MESIKGILEELDKMETDDAALIVSPYTLSPDEYPADIFGGDAALLEIPEKAVSAIRRMREFLPEGADCMGFGLPACIKMHAVTVDTLGKPEPLGHGRETLDLALELGQNADCVAKARVTAGSTEAGAFMSIYEDGVAFGKSAFPKGSIRARYDAEVFIEYPALEALVRQAMGHCMDREEMLDSRMGIFWEDKSLFKGLFSHLGK